MEARPANIEGAGQIGIRDLVRNALRMRPDRIIVGEVRGGEALDMLQAMNTGHEGSLTTIHSNSPRDALTRLDTMVMMAGYDLPVRAIRQQVAAALDVVIQIQRFGDGSRRITHISEIQGMEGDIITLQDIFRYSFAEGGSASATSSGSPQADRAAPEGHREAAGQGGRRPGPALPPADRPSDRRSRHRCFRSERKEAIEEAAMIQLIAILLVGGGIVVWAVRLFEGRHEPHGCPQGAAGHRARRADPIAAGHIQADGEGRRISPTGRWGSLRRWGRSGSASFKWDRRCGPASSGPWSRWASLLAALVVFVVTDSLWWLLVALVLVPTLALSSLKRRAEKRVAKLESQLPEALQLIAGSLDAGTSLMLGMELAGMEGESPLADEFARVVAESAVGRPMLEGLDAMAERIGSKDIAWTVKAIRIQHQTGGRLAETLRVLAEFMHSRQEVRGEVRALSAEARISGKLLIGMPITLGAFLYLTRRPYIEPLFTTPAGNVLLIGAGFGLLLGHIWMKKLAQVEV